MLLLLCAVTAPLDAAWSTEMPTLTQLFELAERVAPELEQLRAELDAARRREPGAHLPADPELELMLQDIDLPRWTIGREEMSMVGVNWRQSWQGRARRTARALEARTSTEEIRARELMLRRELRLQILDLYLELHLNTLQHESLQTGLDLLEVLHQTAMARYATAEVPQSRLWMLQLEIERTRLEQDQLQIARHRSCAQLAVLVDCDEPSSCAPVAWPEQPRWPTLDAALDVELASAAEAAIAERELDSARARESFARADVKPRWSTSVGAFDRGRLDSAFVLSVGVELPIWRADRQQAELAARRSERLAQEAQVARARRQVKNRLIALKAEFDRAQQAAEKLETTLGVLAESEIESTRVAYLSGTGSLESVLESWRRSWQLRREALRERAQAQVVAWQAQLLLGREVE
jgi:outer membrane protein TolC